MLSFRYGKVIVRFLIGVLIKINIMDSSEYKDYILTLLFMKYVTDKFKNKGAYEDIKVFDKAHDKDPDPDKRTGCSFDDFIALKGKKSIGEGMDKIIARLADENTDLKGVIDIAHFNDEKADGSWIVLWTKAEYTGSGDAVKQNRF